MQDNDHPWFPVSILYKSTAGRYRPLRVADGPITARCSFIKNASWGYFIEITFAGSLGRYSNTRPSGLVFKQLPRDPAIVNA